MADLRRLDSALAAASEAETLRSKAAQVDSLKAQVRVVSQHVFPARIATARNTLVHHARVSQQEGTMHSF